MLTPQADDPTRGNIRGNNGPGSPPLDLTESERAALGGRLRETIARDAFPLSPRIQGLKAILAKLDPA